MSQETASSPNALQRKTCDYLLVRHLKPEVEAGICYGQSDLPAAEAPDPAWQELMASRSDLPLLSSPLLSSPLQRARTLADHLSALQRKSSEALAPIGDASALIAEDPRWQEIDFGLWEGQSWADIGQEAIEQWQQNLLDFQFPNGESAYQMQQRVILAWCDWLRQERGGILVSHLGVIRMLLGEVLQIPFQKQLLLQLDYQHSAWLRQTWLEDAQGHRLPDSELWQLRGLNLAPKALLEAWRS